MKLGYKNVVHVEGFEYSQNLYEDVRVFRFKMTFWDRLKFLIHGYKTTFVLDISKLLPPIQKEVVAPYSTFEEILRSVINEDIEKEKSETGEVSSERL